MSKLNLIHRFFPATIAEQVTDLWDLWCQRKYPTYLLLLLIFNLILAPAVQASTGLVLTRPQAYALTLLGLATLILSVYLFVVMFQPERF